MRVLVLLGAPGAGKGTQAQMLAETLDMVHLATGDLFRAAVRAGTPLGLEAAGYMDRGELVPDQITTAMLLERLGQPDASEQGVILDGFPRTRTQAESLESALAEVGGADLQAIVLDVPTERLIERLSDRTICTAAGHPYNTTTRRPRVAGVCDEDGSPLVQRDDDRPETVRARLATQLDGLQAVIDHYDRLGLLGRVDGDRPIDVVASDLTAVTRARFGLAS